MQLIAKLETLASGYAAGSLRRQVTVAGRVKTMNESVYYSVDLLHEAIQKNSRITFRYFDYDLNGSRRYRPGCILPAPMRCAGRMKIIISSRIPSATD